MTESGMTEDSMTEGGGMREGSGMRERGWLDRLTVTMKPRRVAPVGVEKMCGKDKIARGWERGVLEWMCGTDGKGLVLISSIMRRWVRRWMRGWVCCSKRLLRHRQDALWRGREHMRVCRSCT